MKIKKISQDTYTKVCKICQEEKPISEFYFDKKRGKFISYCRECKRNYERKNYYKYKEKREAYYLKHREELKNYYKKYYYLYGKYEEKYKEKRKEYSLRHREELRNYHGKYYLEHKERCLEQQRKYRQEYPEKIREKRRKDRQKNPWRKHLSSARQRCNNPNHDSYPFYGAVRIRCVLTVKEAEFLWKRDKAFEMKQPSIDRIDPFGDYELKNCRFIPLLENQKRPQRKTLEKELQVAL